MMGIFTQRRKKVYLFFAILFLGILVRAWQFGDFPPGLNKDEASIAVEAWSLLHYGVDRHGLSYPVFFISWGSGQHALYAYLLMPFIALFGMNTVVIRLPMLITSILSLPLVYLVGKELEDENLGLLAMFFVAVAPWHIILSRFGLESNILPFVFLTGFVFLIKSLRNNWLFPLAGLFFGLCLYAYGIAYAFVPVFLLAASIVLLKGKWLPLKPLMAGLLVFGLLAIPVLLFILINSLNHDSIQLLNYTIPRLPTRPRYEHIGSLFDENAFGLIPRNLLNLLTLLIVQTDRNMFNVVEPFGYFYTLTFPVIALGIWQVAKKLNENGSPVNKLFLTWIGAAILTGAVQSVYITSINVIFIPLIISAAIFIYSLRKKITLVIPVTTLTLLAACGFFMRDYLGEKYLEGNREAFYVGLEHAIQYAADTSENEICITHQKHQIGPAPYIYVLLAERMDPADYLPTVTYDDPAAEFAVVRTLDRYSFGVEHCKREPATVYIFYVKDDVPLELANYAVKQFEDYFVYSPKKP